MPINFYGPSYRPTQHTFTCTRCQGRITTEDLAEAQGGVCHWCRQIKAQNEARDYRVRTWGPRLPGKGDVVSVYQANGQRQATIERVGPKWVSLSYVPKWNSQARRKARLRGQPVPEVKRNGFRVRLEGFTCTAALVRTAEAQARMVADREAMRAKVQWLG